jgi:hypothetical protein
MAMKIALMQLMFAATAVLACCVSHAMPENIAPAEAGTVTLGGDRRPVLVELFTSEGCSSCPPADKVLAYLDREPVVPNADVITLGLHVDYWDRLGWRDRFSSNQYTRRQEAYARQFKLASTYTPQIVVDGVTELVGSNAGAAVNAIAKSSAEPKGSITLSTGNRQLYIKIDSLPPHNGALVYLAIAEGGLTTQPSSGENAGSRLEHVSVVRQLNQIGVIPAGEASFTLQIPTPSESGWTAKNIKYVVFVQQQDTLKVLGAGQIR